MTHNCSRPTVLLVSVRSLDEALTQSILADSIIGCADVVVAGHESHKDAFGDVTFVVLPEDKLTNMHSALVDAVKKHDPQLIVAPRTLYLEAYCLSEAFSVPIAFLCRVPVAPTASYLDPLWRASSSTLPIGFLNRASFQAVPFAVHNILKQHAPLVDSFRKLLALPPVTSRLGLLGQVYLKNVPSLCLWSPTLVPVPDLPSAFEVVGPSLPPFAECSEPTKRFCTEVS
ncbi:MAG: hypothetical protein KVP17_002163 [Porospora cf. gigantea B]|uniref:uncharacterized protein n=1 Tax=Porospora cf. gigantea B TaxID=2853592 RepID=UPI003571A518|nr:MAG: hypothetical protein KVP17_002163 [Porospora cf. gigantea B]